MELRTTQHNRTWIFSHTQSRPGHSDRPTNRPTNYKTTQTMCKNDPIETIERGKYRIDIYPDMNAIDPLEDSDGYYPMIVKGGRDFNDHDYQDLERTLVQALEAETMNKPEALRTFAATLDYGSDSVARAEEDNDREDFDTDQEREYAIADDIMDEVRELVSSDTISEALETLEAIANFLKWPCLNTCSTGFSQSDYVDVLVCWTPDFAKTTGAKRENVTDEDLRATVKDWGHWAWGSVYGYTVTDTETEEQVGSCWGYYGYEHEKSGLMEGALDEIKGHQRQVIRDHVAKIKAWIRGKRPLMYRNPMPSI